MPRVVGVAAVQGILVGSILLLAGALKLPRNGAVATARAAFARRLIPSARRVIAVRVFGAIEISLGLVMVMTFGGVVPTTIAAGVLAGFVAIQAWALKSHPDQPCGCLGALSSHGASWRSVGRTGLLVLMCLSALVFAEVAVAIPIAGLLLAGDLGALLALSPEIQERRKRTLVAGDCRTTTVDPHVVGRALYRSRLWRRTKGIVQSRTPVDFWREGCWAFLAFPALTDRGQATAVYALHLGRDSHENRMVVVDDETQETLVNVTRPRLFAGRRRAPEMARAFS